MLRTTSFKTLCAGFAEESIRPLARQTGSATPWQHPEPDWNTFGMALRFTAGRQFYKTAYRVVSIFFKLKFTVRTYKNTCFI